MKKIFTLSVALVVAATVFAQSHSYPDRTDNRDVVLGGGNDRTVYNRDSRYDDYTFTIRERDREIQSINREFDARVYEVQRNRWLRPFEKDFQLRKLEQQRRQQIQVVKDRFQNSRNRYNDPYARNNRRW